jgi:hypothetical protein
LVADLRGLLVRPRKRYRRESERRQSALRQLVVERPAMGERALLGRDRRVEVAGEVALVGAPFQ